MQNHDFMKVFDCDPSWPICMYDYTFKNMTNQQQIMRSKHKLSNFIVEDYFSVDNYVRPTDQYLDKLAKRQSIVDDETDLLLEHSPHYCCNNGPYDPMKDFVRNFKILFIKSDDLLLSNPNLFFDLENEGQIV